jgi:hypothetical protein
MDSRRTPSPDALRASTSPRKRGEVKGGDPILEPMIYALGYTID